MTTVLEYQRPQLYPKQKQAIFSQDRYAVIEGSTKSGKTSGCLAWLLEQALQGNKGNAYWWIAPVYPQAKIAFRRLKRGLDDFLYSANESELTITLPNETVIYFKSGEKTDNLYGDDVYGAVIDEASRMREESWFAVRSTLTHSRGAVRIIGNVQGRRNWAYQLARQAEAGMPDWHYAKIIAWDAVEAGILAQEEVEQARSQLPENVFRELYLAEPSLDGSNPFGQQAIRDCISPLVDSDPVVYGVDLAKSVDWTAVIGLDSSGRTCRFERFQKPWTETVDTLQRIIGDTPAIIDSTGVGDPIVETLQKKLGNVEGFKFSSTSKQMLMEGLAVAIQSHEVTFPEGSITAELDAFGYETTRTGVRYSSSIHDDTVCALALAVHGQRSAPSIGVW